MSYFRPHIKLSRHEIFLFMQFQVFDSGIKSVSGALDQKFKDANAYADATRDDFEKVFIVSIRCL